MYNSQNLISKIKSLKLPLEEYIILGGSSLAIRGIRETRDLDIIVSLELFEKFLVIEGWTEDHVYQAKWNRRRLKKEGEDVELYPDLLMEKENKLYTISDLQEHVDLIEGIPFQSLTHLRKGKLDSAREKDLRDIELIDEYLKNN